MPETESVFGFKFACVSFCHTDVADRRPQIGPTRPWAPNVLVSFRVLSFISARRGRGAKNNPRNQSSHPRKDMDMSSEVRDTSCEPCYISAYDQAAPNMMRVVLGYICVVLEAISRQYSNSTKTVFKQYSNSIQTVFKQYQNSKLPFQYRFNTV